MSGVPSARASDHDREHAVGVLRDAVAHGRLSHDTFVTRLDKALRARDTRSLEQLLADLTPPPRPPRPRRLRRPASQWRDRWQRWVGGRGLPPARSPRLTTASREVLIVGRRPTCDIVIADHRVSRVHAVLMLIHDEWLVEDLRSTNGTTLNGTRLRHAAPVRSGDLLGFGGVARRFDLPG